MGNIARATGSSLQDVFALREHARRFGLEAETVTRHISGMQEAMLELSLPGSQARFEDMRQGVNQEFQRRFLAERDHLKRTQLLRDEALKIEQARMREGWSASAAAAIANRFIRSRGGDVEFTRSGNLTPLTQEQIDRLKEWREQTEKVMDAWRQLENPFRGPALEFLASGLKGLSENIKQISELIKHWDEAKFPNITALINLIRGGPDPNGEWKTWQQTIEEVERAATSQGILVALAPYSNARPE